MILFSIMMFGALYRRARRRLAVSDYPAVAVRLGLEHRKASHPKGVGRLVGEIDGLSVIVDPEEEQSLIVRFEHAPAIDFRTYELERAPPRGLRLYRSGNRAVDGFFRTRYAADDLGRVLKAAALERLTRPLREGYARTLKHLIVSSNGVTCVLHFGNPRHIPSSAVLELVPALVALARLIEPKLSPPAIRPEALASTPPVE